MADNYTQFCSTIDDTTVEEEKWLRNLIDALKDQENYCWAPADVVDTSDEAKEHDEGYAAAVDKFGLDTCILVLELSKEGQLENGLGFDWGFEGEGDRRYVYFSDDDQSANIDNTCAVVQQFLKKFRPKELFSVTWADTCSSTRPDQFGGGWAVVSATEIRTGSTYDEVRSLRERVEKGLPWLLA